jgi:hypothetical protein
MARVAKKAEKTKKSKKTSPRLGAQPKVSKADLDSMAERLRRFQHISDTLDRVRREQGEDNGYQDALDALDEDADPKPLINYLRSGQPIPTGHAHRIADLFDPEAKHAKVIAKVSFRKKGPRKKEKQQSQIYAAVGRLRGGDPNKPMPPGAWDQVAAHFKLSRKAVETAYNKQAAEIEERKAQLLKKGDGTYENEHRLIAAVMKISRRILLSDTLEIEELDELARVAEEFNKAAGCLPRKSNAEAHKEFKEKMRAAGICIGDD